MNQELQSLNLGSCLWDGKVLFQAQTSVDNLSDKGQGSQLSAFLLYFCLEAGFRNLRTPGMTLELFKQLICHGALLYQVFHPLEEDALVAESALDHLSGHHGS